MFTSKSLFAAAFASVCLFAAVPSADARPGPVNPFTHPTQAFNWNANQHVKEAKAAIKDASLATAWIVLNPSSRLREGLSGDPMQNGAAGIAQIDSIVSSFTNVINAEASQLSADLTAAGETDLASSVEAIRAHAVAEIETAGVAGKARITAAMKKCSGPTRPSGGGLDSNKQTLENPGSVSPTVQNAQ